MNVYDLYNKETYPNFPFVKERRLYELNWLLPRLKGKSLIDIGCGDGALLNCLYHLTDLELSGCDFSTRLLKNVNHKIKTFLYDCRYPTKLQETDIAIIGNVIVYLEDEEVIELMRNINSKLIFVRSTCGKNERINNYSEALKENYQAYYRNILETAKVLGCVDKIFRIYPDEIESKFGTKQYYFICKK